MTPWLAQAGPAESSSGIVTFVGVLVPVGVIVGALISSLFTWWISRRRPSDELKSLVDVYKDWPRELDGVRTLTLAIQRELARIRIAADEDDMPGATPIELFSEKRIKAARESRQRNYGDLIAAVGGVLIAAVSTSVVLGNFGPWWFYPVLFGIGYVNARFRLLNRAAASVFRLLRKPWDALRKSDTQSEPSQPEADKGGDQS